MVPFYTVPGFFLLKKNLAALVWKASKCYSIYVVYIRHSHKFL